MLRCRITDITCVADRVLEEGAMAKYMVMGEISLMSAILRRSMRYSHQNESIEELIRSFSSLKVNMYDLTSVYVKTLRE